MHFEDVSKTISKATNHWKNIFFFVKNFVHIETGQRHKLVFQRFKNSDIDHITPTTYACQKEVVSYKIQRKNIEDKRSDDMLYEKWIHYILSIRLGIPQCGKTRNLLSIDKKNP